MPDNMTEEQKETMNKRMNASIEFVIEFRKRYAQFENVNDRNALIREATPQCIMSGIDIRLLTL